MKFRYILPVMAFFMVACSPEVGTPEWCKSMGNKAKMDWTAQEAADYTKYCIFKE